MNRPSLWLSAVLVVFAAVAPARAQSGGGKDLSLNVIACGGGSAAGGAFTVSGTIGQSDAGPTLSAGGLTLRGGFWPAAAPPFCLGDATFDGVVNFSDILTVLANFNASYGPGNTGPGDANNDHVVNFSDVLAVLANFNAVCP